MEKELVLIEYNEIEFYVGCEIHILLSDGNEYTGIVKDVDDDEIILSNPESKVCLGFKLDWISGSFVLKEDYDTIMNEN